MAGESVLIAEGDGAYLNEVAKIVRSTGAKPILADSCARAITLISGEPTTPIVLLNLKLPDRSGLELLKWLRENRPEAKVVVLSDTYSQSMRQALDRRGVVAYLEKPFGKAELSSILERLRTSGAGFVGHVKRISLLDFVQLLVITGRTTMLHVMSRTERLEGVIVFEEGEIVDAWTGSVRGEEAFTEIASWEGGTFEEVPLPGGRARERSIERPVEQLLLSVISRKEGRYGEPAPPGRPSGVSERLNTLLRELSKEIPAFIGASVFNVRRGEPIAFTTVLQGKNFETSAALYSEVVRVVGDAVEIATSGAERREELERVTLTDRHDHIVIETLKEGRYCLFLIFGRDGNVGLSLNVVSRYARLLEECF